MHIDFDRNEQDSIYYKYPPFIRHPFFFQAVYFIWSTAIFRVISQPLPQGTVSWRNVANPRPRLRCNVTRGGVVWGAQAGIRCGGWEPTEAVGWWSCGGGVSPRLFVVQPIVSWRSYFSKGLKEKPPNLQVVEIAPNLFRRSWGWIWPCSRWRGPTECYLGRSTPTSDIQKTVEWVVCFFHPNFWALKKHVKLYKLYIYISFYIYWVGLLEGFL